MLVVKADKIVSVTTGIPIISQFSTVIMKGDRVGILGPNGSGKTTLFAPPSRKPTAGLR